MGCYSTRKSFLEIEVLDFLSIYSFNQLCYPANAPLIPKSVFSCPATQWHHVSLKPSCQGLPRLAELPLQWRSAGSQFRFTSRLRPHLGFARLSK